MATPTQSPSPTPTPSAASAAAPATRTVAFSGLPAGTYITHLHSACNGSQNFHVTVLQSLQISGSGTGSVTVPSSYFGRGLCVIVYANSSLTSVLTTRRI